MNVDPCWLITTPVKECDPRAQQYRDAFLKVPPAHRALVKLIVVSDDHPLGKAYNDGMIRIPAVLHPGQLWHEVGHLVSWDNDKRLLKAFSDCFWSANERPLRGKPSSDYAKRHGAAEDFAETYRRLRRGDKRTARIEWMRQMVG